MAAPTVSPELDILSRLEATLDDVPDDPNPDQESQPTEQEEEAPVIKEPGEEPEPVSAKEEAPAVEEEPTEEEKPTEEKPTEEETSEDFVQTMTDLAKMFEVDETELLEHLQVEGPDGSVKLSEVIATYKNAPQLVRRADELTQREAAFVQESQQYRVRADEQIRELAVSAQALLDMTNEEFKDLDWRKLEDEDPQQYLVMKEKQRERGQLITRAVEKMKGAEQQRIQEMQADSGKTRQQEQEALYGKMPSWKDPSVAQPAMSETQAFLSESGFSPDEINGITDHRYLLVAWEAAQYRKLKNQTPKKIDKLRALPKPKRVLRSSARRDVSADTKKASQQKMDRLRKTGDERDAARLFEELM